MANELKTKEDYITDRLGYDSRCIGTLRAELERNISDVLNTSDEWIKKCRERMEDYGFSTEKLSDLDISIIDVYVRQTLMDYIREDLVDPFDTVQRNGKYILPIPEVDIREYLTHKFGLRWEDVE